MHLVATNVLSPASLSCPCILIAQGQKHNVACHSTYTFVHYFILVLCVAVVCCDPNLERSWSWVPQIWGSRPIDLLSAECSECDPLTSVQTGSLTYVLRLVVLLKKASLHRSDWTVLQSVWRKWALQNKYPPWLKWEVKIMGEWVLLLLMTLMDGWTAPFL